MNTSISYLSILGQIILAPWKPPGWVSQPDHTSLSASTPQHYPKI